jgi:hypothetical protein
MLPPVGLERSDGARKGVESGGVLDGMEGVSDNRMVVSWGDGWYG